MLFVFEYTVYAAIVKKCFIEHVRVKWVNYSPAVSQTAVSQVHDGKTNLLNTTTFKVLHGFCPKTSVNAPLSGILQKQTTQMANRGPNTLTWAPMFLLSRLDVGLIWSRITFFPDGSSELLFLASEFGCLDLENNGGGFKFEFCFCELWKVNVKMSSKKSSYIYSEA